MASTSKKLREREVPKPQRLILNPVETGVETAAERRRRLLQLALLQQTGRDSTVLTDTLGG